MAPINSRDRFNRWLSLGTLISVGLAIVVLYFMMRNPSCTLYIVNGFDDAATITIPVHGTLIVPGRGKKELLLPAGDHQLTISGPSTDSVHITLDSSSGDGLTFVLNVGGQAILGWEDRTFDKSGRAETQGHFQYRLYYGDSFLTMPAVDYLFQPFPTSIPEDPEGGANEVKKSRIDVLQAPVVQIFVSLIQAGQMNNAFELAEWKLRRSPDEDSLLETYVQMLLMTGQSERGLEYLQAGCKRRPVEIPWHRTYQDLKDSPGTRSALLEEYDAYLKEDPNQSALLYLRGRLTYGRKASNDYFKQALQTDKQNPYAHHGLAYASASAGDWEASKNHAEKALLLDPDNAAFEIALFQARMALGDFKEIEQELQSRLKKDALRYDEYEQLGMALIAQQNTKGARDLCDQYRNQHPSVSPDKVLNPVDLLEMKLLYAAGDFVGLEKKALETQSLSFKIERFRALLEQGRLDEAVKILPMDTKEIQDPYHFLLVSLAFRMKGDSQTGDAWRTKAMGILEKGSQENQAVARLLQKTEAIEVEEITEINLPFERARTLAVVLAQRDGKSAQDLLTYARKLNVDRAYPFHFLKRILETRPGSE